MSALLLLSLADNSLDHIQTRLIDTLTPNWAAYDIIKAARIELGKAIKIEASK